MPPGRKFFQDICRFNPDAGFYAIDPPGDEIGGGKISPGRTIVFLGTSLRAVASTSKLGICLQSQFGFIKAQHFFFFTGANADG